MHTKLHTKFPGNRLIGSREDFFLNVFTIYGRGGHVEQVTKAIFTFLFLKALEAEYVIWVQSASGTDDDGGAFLSYKLSRITYLGK